MSARREIPLRPMTLGELLDAAVSLPRRRPRPLLSAAAVLAVAEQVVLAPLRERAGLSAPYFLPEHDIAGWWLLTGLGFAIEATIITLLGALAAGGMASALLGRPVRDRALWRTCRPVATVLTAVIFGGACGAAALAGFLPWIFGYGLLGLAAPALVVDRSGNPFSALARSARLTSRSGLRGCWVRIAAYLTWFAIRFALGAGWIAVLTSFSGSWPQWLLLAVPVAWALADTVAYAALACVDAVLLVEIRVRTEGLDIALARARSRGENETAVLVQSS
jgi:hypothetical protein